MKFDKEYNGPIKRKKFGQKKFSGLHKQEQNPK